MTDYKHMSNIVDTLRSSPDVMRCTRISFSLIKLPNKLLQETK